MNLPTQRQRAANAIRDRILCWGDPPAPQSDRLVDGWARALLELPAGPEGDKPYVGWLPETSGQNPPRRQMPSDRLGMRLQTGIILIPPQ